MTDLISKYLIQKPVKQSQIASGYSPIQLQMHKVLILLLLTYSTYSQTVVAKSDTTNTIGSALTPATLFPLNFPASLIPGTVGIWNSQGNLSPQGTVVTFTKTIYLSCGGPLKISIAAYGNYKIWWDGINVFNGSNSDTLATYALASKCGKHELSITVTKTGAALKPSGVIYSLSQDQSGCFNCNSNGFWNENTCACECLQGNLCGCPLVPGTQKNKTWSPYPTCACVCPKSIISFPLAAAQTLSQIRSDIANELSASFAPLCLGANQYYSPVTCSCLCHVQYCPPKHEYNVDPTQSGGCGCRQLIY